METIDHIINWFDDHPKTSDERIKIILRIIETLGNNDDLERDAMRDARSEAFSTSRDEIHKRAWEDFEDLDDKMKSRRRLVMMMTATDLFDAYDAGFIVGWAEDAGIDKDDLLSIFKEFVTN